MSVNRDPREIITPDAFQVKAELLGLPLASPWRRGLAITIDFAFLGLILAFRSISSTIFWLAVVWVLFRTTSRKAKGGVKSGTGRRLVRTAAIFILVVLVGLRVASWWLASGTDTLDLPVTINVTGEDGDRRSFELGDILRAGGGAIRLRQTEDAEEAGLVLDDLAATMRQQGLSAGEIRDVLAELAGDTGDRPWMEGAIVAATEGFAEEEATRGSGVRSDSLALAYATALGAQDTVEMRALRPALAAELSADQIERLESRIEDLSQDLDQSQSDTDEGPSIVATIRSLLDEIGLGVGWIGLYFTVFTVLMNGQTPGKRLLGMRVVRLNGEAIGWWTSFSRFGGYAAGLFTGFLGFFEAFWDANRQGLQDKMVGTVVISTKTHVGDPPTPN